MNRILLFIFIPFLLDGLTITHTDQNIKIDGNLEEAWLKAKPLSNFIQSSPDEGKPATEDTYVYLLTDNINLYVAFQCYTNNRYPVENIRGWDNASGDLVTLYIDTFGDKRTCYYFNIAASGTQGDGLALQGGVAFDNSWDGVWFAKTKRTDYGYCIEMKIPLKAIKYSKFDWGIQFRRYIPTINETDYWQPVPSFPGFRITQFAPIDGINSTVKGRFLEIYPVGLVKYNDKINGSAGLDLAYNPSSEFGFNMTVNPDFAQIEADPFQVNLSEYSIYLSEKRPFFLEGQNMFNIRRSNNFNIGPGAIKILYTRNIGKIVDDTIEVPIRAGVKFTTRGKGFEGGAMYVNTGAARTEPMAHYIAIRAARDIFEGGLLGVTYTGKESELSHTRILTLDGNYMGKFGDITSQFSYADSSGIEGFAGYLNYQKLTNKYMTGVYINHLDSNYRINEVGYTNMKGTQFGAAFAPIFLSPIENIRLCGFGLGGGITKDAWGSNYSKGIWFFEFINTSNNLNENVSFNISDTYEDTSGVEIHYTDFGINGSVNSDFSKIIAVSMWGNLSYSFNYMANHLGYQFYSGVYAVYKPLPNLWMQSSINYITYWINNTTFKDIFNGKRIEDSYVTISPSIGYHFSRNLEFNINSEIVYLKSLGKAYRYRINPILSYNVSPKSWIYFVYTRTEVYDSDISKFITSDQGIALKIRYLLYI